MLDSSRLFDHVAVPARRITAALVVRQLNDDLRLGVEIVGGRLVRDDDGLALSSRNVYLEPAGRAQARVVPKRQVMR